MKVAGIVAEFNPLHTGHERIMNYCRKELGADAVIVCMSGDFVQRGEPAIINKYVRAGAAIGSVSEENSAIESLPVPEGKSATARIRSGADLCIELPVIGATANAEVFARTGVNTLLSTGIVTDLVFGSESGDEGAIENAARLLLDEPPEFKASLNECMKSGLSYPAAMAKAAAACGTDAAIFNNPNDLLGLLYVKALLEYEKAHGTSQVSFHAYKREGAGHDESACTGDEYASSSALRKTIGILYGPLETALATPDADEIDLEELEKNEKDFLKQNLSPAGLSVINTAIKDCSFVFPDDISLLLHEKLYSVNGPESTSGNTSAGLFPKTDLTIFSDIDEDLTNRILRRREDFTTFTEYAEALDARNYTRARLRRALLHIVLGITDEAAASLQKCNYAPYIHVLAMNEVGTKLLGEMKAGRNAHLHEGEQPSKTNSAGQTPVFCALSEPAARELSEDAAICLQKDIFADELYNIILTGKTGMAHKNEFSKKVIRV
ncbi:MAG: nucleotidyltransferase family protein [Lachnospiraceae bacterium]|nr:nucleotidyltransferase family protein [Lachnospiraceae bacterium]